MHGVNEWGPSVAAHQSLRLGKSVTSDASQMTAMAEWRCSVERFPRGIEPSRGGLYTYNKYVSRSFQHA